MALDIGRGGAWVARVDCFDPVLPDHHGVSEVDRALYLDAIRANGTYQKINAKYFEFDVYGQ